MSGQIETQYVPSTDDTKPHVLITGLTDAEYEQVVRGYDLMPTGTPCGPLAGIKKAEDGSVCVFFERHTSAGMMEGFIRGGLLARNGLSEASGRLAPRTR